MGDEWMLLLKLEIPFQAEEGEANLRSRELVAEVEARVGLRVGSVTIRRWMFDVATRKPEPAKMVPGRPGSVAVGPKRRRGLSRGPID